MNRREMLKTTLAAGSLAMVPARLLAGPATSAEELFYSAATATEKPATLGRYEDDVNELVRYYNEHRAVSAGPQLAMRSILRAYSVPLLRLGMWDNHHPSADGVRFNPDAKPPVIPNIHAAMINSWHKPIPPIVFQALAERLQWVSGNAMVVDQITLRSPAGERTPADGVETHFSQFRPADLTSQYAAHLILDGLLSLWTEWERKMCYCVDAVREWAGNPELQCTVCCQVTPVRAWTVQHPGYYKTGRAVAKSSTMAWQGIHTGMGQRFGLYNTGAAWAGPFMQSRQRPMSWPASVRGGRGISITNI